MRKLIAFFIASCLCAGVFLFVERDYDEKIKTIKFKQQSEETGKAYNNYYIMQKMLAEQKKSILLMGSSELSRYNEKSFPTEVFNAKTGVNLTLYGAGHYQSLVHTIALGGLDDGGNKNKIVFIISPQWFSKDGTKESFASVFSESLMGKFIENDRIPSQIKNTVITRAKELLKGNKDLSEAINNYEKSYNRAVVEAVNSLPKDSSSNHTEQSQEDPSAIREMNGTIDHFIAKAGIGLKEKVTDLKTKRELIETNKDSDLKPQTPEVIEDAPNAAGKIDFKAMLEEAERQGKENSTNNPFYVYNDYYDTYMRKEMQTLKNAIKQGYLEKSPEFDDLQLFIDVAKALNKEVKLVSVPMNGYWYDYVGHDKAQRKSYYERIRKIAFDNQMRLADYSGNEYEKYFLRDIMHLGWKGWVYIDEDIYQFAKED